MFGKIIHKVSLIKLLASFCAGAMLVHAPVARAQSDKTYIVDLPALSLERSLTRLAQQIRISVDFSTFDLKHTKRPAVLGLYTLEEALKAVLDGTPYAYHQVGSGAYRIILKPTKSNREVKTKVAKKNTTPSVTRDVIIVRATKRAGLASRLPLGLSVTDSAQLEMLQITDTNALALYTAGMSSTNLGPSRNKIFIRGISDGSFTGRQQATIGAYLDNIRLNYNEPDPFLQLDDVDHVEVLRGPQGTLYGAGSLGGLYRVITNAPDIEKYAATISLGTSLTRNGGQNGRIGATVNMPLKHDQLALRITGYLYHNDGYIDDVKLGINNVNSTDVFGTRARILWNMNENWEINAGFNFQDVIADDSQYFLSELGNYKRANYVREPHEDDFVNPYAEAKGNYGWGEIVSSTIFIRRSISDQIDASLGVPIIIPFPVTPSVFKRDRKINMISNETRLVSRLGGKLDWLVGGFVSQRRESFQSSLNIPGSAAVLPGGNISGDLAFSETRRERTQEVAFFGEGIWHLPFSIDLTGGVRWFHSDEHTRATVDGALGTAPVMRLGKTRGSGFSPKATLSFQANDNTLLYVQMAQGNRVGGININSPDSVFFEDEGEGGEEERNRVFEPDKLTMYEVGGKFSFQNDRLRVHATAFTFKWDDIQSDQILPNGFPVILNAGYARSRGIDVDILFEPFPGLSLDANFSFNDPDLVIVNPFLGSEVNDHLPGIPSLAGGLIAEYDWAASAERRWFFSADFTFTGRSQLTFARVDNRDAERTYMLNLRLALEQQSQWQASIFVRNILNEKANTFAFGNPFSFRQNLQHTPPVPQTIGITLRRQF